MATPKFGISPFPTRALIFPGCRGDAAAELLWVGFCGFPPGSERRGFGGQGTAPSRASVLLSGSEMAKMEHLKWWNRNQTSKKMELIIILLSPLYFSPPRQGLQCSCCPAQLGHTEISTWKHSAFIPEKLLLNLEHVYSHYSYSMNFQADLLSAHSKQHILAFQAGKGFGSHHS